MDVMQIMNLSRLFKHLGWFLTSYNTLNKLPDAVLLVNADGIIESYNKRAKDMFGFVDGGFGKYDLADIVEDYNSVVAKSADLSAPVLTSASLPDERKFFVELNAKPRRRGYCVVIRDLTSLTKELKNEEKIIKFNNEKNAMLAKLEDDIKAPLSSISGFSQGLLDGLGGGLSEKQAKYVKIINNNAVELTEFIEKLMGFSKVESSIYEGNIKTFDVIELIKNQAKEFEVELEEKGVALAVDGESLKNRNIYTDANALQEACKNIFEVAVSMTEKGYISVKLSNPADDVCELLKIKEPEKYLQIEIRDTGVGFAVEDMKYLCEPYAQLEKGKKNILRAFRLGIASILIKRSNGFITVKSEVTKGTRYEIILPVEKR